MTKDNEYQVCHYLGQRNLAHFVDMNPLDKIFDLPYIGMTKRCEEAERRICFLTQICQEYHVGLRSCESLSELTQLIAALAEHRQMVSRILLTKISPNKRCSTTLKVTSVRLKTSSSSNSSA